MGQFFQRKRFFAEEWWEKFRISRRSLFKPADEMRVNPHTCGRESSIWIRCVWTWKFLNPERKNCGLKNTQIRVEGTLEECQAYRELTGCHRFSCRPVLLISCVVVRPSCVQKWILLEWLFSVLPFLLFSNSRYAGNRGYKVVLGHLFKSMLSLSATSSSSFSLSSSSSSPSSFSSSPSSWLSS